VGADWSVSEAQIVSSDASARTADPAAPPVISPNDDDVRQNE